MDIGYFLKLMTEKNASDMFLTTGAPVYIKVEGKLYPLGNTGLPAGMVKKIAYSLMDEGQVPVFERDLELFAWLAAQVTSHELVWDVGCGTGQASVALAPRLRIEEPIDAWPRKRAAWARDARRDAPRGRGEARGLRCRTGHARRVADVPRRGRGVLRVRALGRARMRQSRVPRVAGRSADLQGLRSASGLSSA